MIKIKVIFKFIIVLLVSNLFSYSSYARRVKEDSAGVLESYFEAFLFAKMHPGYKAKLSLLPL